MLRVTLHRSPYLKNHGIGRCPDIPLRPCGEALTRAPHVILFLGRIHWIKGLDILVKAYGRLAREREKSTSVNRWP